MMNDVPIPTETNPYHDVQSIAQITQFKPATIRTWLRSGRLKGFQISGEWRVMHDDFVQFLEEEYGDEY